jgi:hypothetical protein
LRAAACGLLAVLLCGAVRLAAQTTDRYAGSFLQIPVGGKALGLGGAFTAIADDGTAFYWNPAGVSLLDKKVLSGMYSSQYGPIGSPLASYYFVGWSMPVKVMNISVNWIRFAVSDIPARPDLTQVTSVQDRYEQVIQSATNDETFADTEDAFIFSFARNNKVNLSFGWNYFTIPIEIPVGVNLKLVRQSLFDNNASAIGIDAGTMVRINLQDLFFATYWPSISFGLTVKDIGGTRMTWEQTQRIEKIDQATSFGFALTQPLRFIDSRAILSWDQVSHLRTETNVGLDVQYRKQFSFRVGLNDNALTVGAGVDFNFFDVDYAYLGYSAQQLGSVHRLGLAFNFDKLFEKSSK